MAIATGRSGRFRGAHNDKRDELVKVEPGFELMAKDFIGMQVAGIDADPEIAVHPGLARFLQEHKAWNDKWDRDRLELMR